MEQRIGSSSQPLEGAGFDPAFIPGLTSPATSGPQDAVPGDRRGEDPEDGDPQAGDPRDGDAASDGTGSASGAPASDDAVSDGPEGEEPAGGPVFEAADRRARIVADGRGVRLRLDAEECEFRWDEIGAVETETPRFGKRYTITVHTPDRRWYPIEIEATSRARFEEWDGQLDAVLDAYFDDGAEAEPTGEKATTATPEAAETGSDSGSDADR